MAVPGTAAGEQKFLVIIGPISLAIEFGFSRMPPLEGGGTV
jgi:hypothetical protein